jgi:hypothetical protein
MGIYILQNGNKVGPLGEDQVIQMLHAGSVSTDTLGWKEGMATWECLSTFALPKSGNLPTKSRGNSWLGIISIILGLVSVVAWFALLIIAAVNHHYGTVTKTSNVITGAFALVVFFLNLLALILGVVGSFKPKANTMAIVGACLNALVLIVMIALVCLGLATKQGH